MTKEKPPPAGTSSFPRSRCIPAVPMVNSLGTGGILSPHGTPLLPTETIKPKPHMTTRDLPPIILLLLDAAGANRFSLYGYHRRTTPEMERLAPEAAVYRYCFTPSPWTIPSHASLFTGLYPHEHECNSSLTGMRSDLLVLPEILRDMGYHTVGISSNFLVSRPVGFHRGFTEFYEMGTLFQDPRYLEAKTRYLKARKELKTDWDRTKYIFKSLREIGDYTFPIKKNIDKLYQKFFADPNVSTVVMTRRTMRLAKKLIKRFRAHGSPFFMLINLMETHRAFEAPFPFNQAFQQVNPQVKKRLADPAVNDFIYEEDPALRKERADLWNVCLDQEILFTDSLVGDFHRFLRGENLLDRVLWIITSDHGEGMGEHGLFDHYFSVYNEVLHIPLIVKYPRDFGVRGEFSHLAQLHDVFATLCEIADAPWPIPFSSHSLLNGSRDFAFAELLDNSRGIDYMRRRKQSFTIHSCMLPGDTGISADLWKLIRWQDGTRELYDLNRDLHEEVNLIKDPQYVDKAAFLDRQLKEVRDNS